MGQDFFLSILNANSTKREARSYIQRFTPPRPPAMPSTNVDVPVSLTTTVDAVRTVPQTAVTPAVTTVHTMPVTVPEELHLALVKIRDVAAVEDAVLLGVARTLRQLRRLGLVAVVVVDEPTREASETQADRVVAALEQNRVASRRVDGIITTASLDGVDGGERIRVSGAQHLLAPAARGVVPVLSSTAVTSAQQLRYAPADDVVGALVHCLAEGDERVDRIIFLDSLGGLPAPERGPVGAHVFVNLAQEFDALASTLQGRHADNLRTLHKALAFLPPSSSAVITTPAAAATRSRPCSSSSPSSSSGSGSSSLDRNPLIHNLLTDKPVFSSSLPTSASPPTPTTLLKAGMPLRIWRSGTRLSDPSSGIDLPRLVALIEDSFGKTLDVHHYLARVDQRLALLVVAGEYDGAAIVTWEKPPGKEEKEKEGDGKGEREEGGKGERVVAYLDKFAVARRSQGAGGVADVVFKAMASQFGDGIVWRSRRENVVNKWYFERAKGAWKIPGTVWTMFWTTAWGGGGEGAASGGSKGLGEGVGEVLAKEEEEGGKRFEDAVAICSSIEPSLKDGAG